MTCDVVPRTENASCGAVFRHGHEEKETVLRSLPEKVCVGWMASNGCGGETDTTLPLCFSKRILLCTLMTTDFIEFQTNECFSNLKETINKSIQTRVELLLLPRRFEVLLHGQYWRWSGTLKRLGNNNSARFCIDLLMVSCDLRRNRWSEIQ